MSIVAFLGLQRGEAGSSPEQPQWRSPFDGADHSQLDLAALRAAARVLAAPAGSVSSYRPIPPPADWAPPAEIARTTPAVERRSARALVWLQPAEIAFAGSFADALVMAVRSVTVQSAAGRATPLPHSTIWAPPAEIAPMAPVVEGRSAAGDGAPVWLPPAEIAPAILDAAAMAIVHRDRPSPIPPPVVWASPAEIAPEASARVRAATVDDVEIAWQPPKEIARGARRADDV